VILKRSETPYDNNPECGKYVKFLNDKIYYEIYGEGKTFVVIHGGGVNKPYDICLIDVSHNKYRVIIITIRYQGRSEIGHSPLNYEQKTKNILTVPDQENKKKKKKKKKKKRIWVFSIYITNI